MTRLMTYVAAAGGLSLLCVAWYFVQRFVARRDPEAPGVERECGSCSVDGCRKREEPRS